MKMSELFSNPQCFCMIGGIIMPRWLERMLMFNSSFIILETMIRGLTRLGWERVDVNFRKSIQRLLAHTTIQASIRLYSEIIMCILLLEPLCC